MGISLRKLLEDRAEVTVNTPAGPLRVAYRPGRLTLRMVMALQEGIADLPAALAELVADWDLLDDAGQPIPVTPEVAAGLPLWLIRVILEAIVQDWTLKAKT